MDGFNFIVKLRDEKEALLEENIALRNQLSQFEHSTMNNCKMSEPPLNEFMERISKEMNLKRPEHVNSCDEVKQWIISQLQRVAREQATAVYKLEEVQSENDILEKRYQSEHQQHESSIEILNRKLTNFIAKFDELQRENNELAQEVKNLKNAGDLSELVKFEMKQLTKEDQQSQDCSLLLRKRVRNAIEENEQLGRFVQELLVKMDFDLIDYNKLATNVEARKQFLEKKHEMCVQVLDKNMADCKAQIDELQRLKDGLEKEVKTLKDAEVQYKQELLQLRKENKQAQECKILLQKKLKEEEEKNERQGKTIGELQQTVNKYSAIEKKRASQLKEAGSQVTEQVRRVHRNPVPTVTAPSNQGNPIAALSTLFGQTLPRVSSSSHSPMIGKPYQVVTTDQQWKPVATIAAPSNVSGQPLSSVSSLRRSFMVDKPHQVVTTDQQRKPVATIAAPSNVSAQPVSTVSSLRHSFMVDKPYQVVTADQQQLQGPSPLSQSVHNSPYVDHSSMPIPKARTSSTRVPEQQGKEPSQINPFVQPPLYNSFRSTSDSGKQRELAPRIWAQSAQRQQQRNELFQSNPFVQPSLAVQSQQQQLEDPSKLNRFDELPLPDRSFFYYEPPYEKYNYYGDD